MMINNVPDTVREIANAFAMHGGTTYVVGGFVRDQLLQRSSKDLDLEVFGVDRETIEVMLSRFGTVDFVGASYGSYLIKELPGIEVTMPRRDRQVGPLHTDVVVEVDPHMTLQEAAGRRDLTINAIYLNVLTSDVVDPTGHGLNDLENRVLRPCDVRRFGEDPLRALRAVRFASILAPCAFTGDLMPLIQQQDLKSLPGERIAGELEKILLLAPRPALAFDLLHMYGQIGIFPELEAMIECPQSPVHHPEGSVFSHTMMVVDEAAKLRTGDKERDLVLMYGALLHDAGKPLTTEVHDDGRITSYEHDRKGVEPAREFLLRLKVSLQLVDKVALMVKHHMAPSQFMDGGARRGAYARIVRQLSDAGLEVEELVRVGRSDHMGREHPDAIADRVTGRYPPGEHFLEMVRTLDLDKPTAKTDVVLGRHLIARGMKPGKHFGPILERCRERQFETGELDPNVILDAVLAEGAA